TGLPSDVLHGRGCVIIWSGSFCVAARATPPPARAAPAAIKLLRIKLRRASSPPCWRTSDTNSSEIKFSGALRKRARFCDELRLSLILLAPHDQIVFYSPVRGTAE